MSRLNPVRVIVAVVVLGSLMAGGWAATAQSGYGRSLPGPVINLSPVTGIGVTDGPSDGSWRMMTVLTEQLSWLDLFRATLDDEEIVALNGNASIVDGFREMRAERAVASSVASWMIGGTPPQSDGVLVAAVQPGSAAERAGLIGGDVIVTVNDEVPDGVEDVLARLDADTDLVLQIRRDIDMQSIAVSLGSDGHAGLVLVPSVSGSTSDAFQVDTGAVQGPSAGLMMTLAFLDAATEGDLTAGLVITGTGTVDVDGTVGKVGGIGKKIEAAAGAGAGVFFLPYSQKDAAVFGPDVLTVPVVTVSDAVSWLCGNGGTAQGLCDLPEPGATSDHS